MSNEYPIRGEIFQLQEAIDQCFRNEQSHDPIDMSSMIECATGEETLKLKTMKNKMSIFELKHLVTQLLQLIREQNTWIKRSMREYRESIREMSRQLVERVERKWVIFKTLQQQIRGLKESEEKWLGELKGLRVEIEVLQGKREEEIRSKEEIQRLKVMVAKEREISERKVEVIKKESYKVYESNFDLEQTISTLEDELEQQREEFEIKYSTQARVVDKLGKEIERLKNTVSSFNSEQTMREQKIDELEKKLIQANQAKMREQINSVSKQGGHKVSPYHLNLGSINKEFKRKNQQQQYSIERSIKSSRNSEREIKLSAQTIEFMKGNLEQKPSQSSKQCIADNALSPYMIKSRDTISSRKRSMECNTMSPRGSEPISHAFRAVSKEKFDFNKIQLEIDKLKNRLETDLTKSRSTRM